MTEPPASVKKVQYTYGAMALHMRFHSSARAPLWMLTTTTPPMRHEKRGSTRNLKLVTWLGLGSGLANPNLASQASPLKLEAGHLVALEGGGELLEAEAQHEDAHAQQQRGGRLIGEIQGRCRGDTGEMQGRYRGDIGEI